MTSTPLPAAFLATIQGFASRFAQIMSYLIAIRVCEKPELGPLVVPLSQRLSRLAHRLQRLLALLAAGLRPRQWPPRPGRPSRARPPSVLPTRKGWVHQEWGWRAAGFRQNLYDLLIQPEIVDLLAAEPALGRILRPFCHMFGLPKPGERKPDPKPYRPTTPPPLPTATPYPPPLTRLEQWSREWNRLKAR